MPDVQHNTLTAAELHEPKGVATAAAGRSYVADGAGSGAWEDIHGWGQFQDTDRTVGTPAQTLSPGVRTKFTCDGGFLTTEYPPSDQSVPMWDVVNNKHVPIAEFDAYNVRISFTAEDYSGATPYLEMDLDIGSPINTILQESRPLLKGGNAQPFVWSFPVFTGDTYFANGGEVYLTYQGSGTCKIYSNSVMIARISRNN